MARRVIALALFASGVGCLFLFSPLRAAPVAPEVTEAMEALAAPTEASAQEKKREPAQPATTALAVADDPTSITGRLSSLAERAERLEATDQQGLDRLFAELATVIRADQDGAHQRFFALIPSFPEQDTMRTFFLVHGFLKFGNRAEDVVHRVSSHTVPADQAADPHGHTSTAWERNDRVRAFSLRQYRTLRASGGTSEAGRRLVPELKGLAANDPSLDVAREAVLLLRRVSPDAASDVRDALSGRTAAERAVLEP